MREATLQAVLPGREELMAEVLGALLSPEAHGALLLGHGGLGKTAVAKAVLARCGDKVRAFQTAGSAVLANEPFGVLAPFLAGFGGSTFNSTVDVLQAVSAALESSADGQPVLVVEDAQYLDEGSAMVLAQLAASNRAKLLLLCTPFPAVPDFLWSMCSDGLLQSFELQPLDPETMRSLCQQTLGGMVFPSAGATLCHRAAGNPMFLLETIAHARHMGVLVERNGVWQLVGPLQGSTARVKDIVGQMLLQFSNHQRQALEYVALAGTLRLDVLLQLCSSAVVDGLEESGIIDIRSDPDRLVRLAAPPMGNVICELLPAAQTMAMRRRLMALLDLTVASHEVLLRSVDWALKDGIQVSEIHILRAAQLANVSRQPELARRASAAVQSPQRREAALLEQLRALILRGDYAAARILFDGIATQSAIAEVVRVAASLCGHGGLRPGLDGPALAAVATGWQAAVARLEEAGSLPQGSNADDHRMSVRLLEIQAMHGVGNYHGTELELTHIYTLSPAGSQNLLVSAALLSDVFASTGRGNRALELSAQAIDMLGQQAQAVSHLADFVMRRHLTALCQVGDYATLRTAVEQTTLHHIHALAHNGGSYQLALGLCDVAQGAMNGALEKLIQAVEALHHSDPGNDLPLALAATAYAAAVLGRETVKEQYFALCETSDPARDAASALRARAFLVAAHGLFQGNPRSKLRLVADEAAALGMLQVEMDVLTMSIHAGDLGLALRLKAVASRCEGIRARNTADYAKALAEKDPKALLAISDAAESDGRELDAAQSAANAVAILKRRGDRNRLHGAQRLAKRRMSTLVYGQNSLSARLSTVPQLTRREQKVAALVHNGASNRDIASEFGLSLRTVEGHLYRIFAKLGISDRSEISDTAIDSWRFEDMAQ